MARKIAKGNCHKKAATKKAAKQFIVAAPRYSILWLSGKHIHIHMQTYTHIRAHSSTLRAVHTPMHFYCSILLCAAKTIFVILPARGFRCFLRSFLSLHTHRQVSKVCVFTWVCAVLCTVPICLGHSHKKLRSFSRFEREAGQPGDVAAAAAQCWFYFIPYPQCGDYFVYNAFLIGLGHKLYSNWLCNQREISWSN